MFKYLIQELDIPFFICLCLLITGIILLWIKKSPKTMKILLTTGTCLLILLGNRFFIQYFLMSSEAQYPSLLSTKDLGALQNEISYVVVLSASYRSNPAWPITSQLGTRLLPRLIEGIRLYKSLPKAKLVLSGGNRKEISDAEMMEKLAIELGVKKSEIVLEKKSQTTYEEVIFLKHLLKDQKFILVTSARHMPRALALFQEAGLQPIPAPTDHTLALPSGHLSIDDFIPRAGYIGVYAGAVYENLAFIKAKLSGSLK